MAERTIEAAAREQFELDSTDELVLVFLRITHPSLMEPICVVSDPANFILDDEEYTGYTFDINILNDNDSPPRARLTIQNIDRIIGEAILAAVNPARIDLKLISGDQFDLTVEPREPIGSPAYMYHARQLYLTEIEGTASTITGTLRSWDYTQEVWPGVRATENRLPGLYW